jgi:uncharacterized protein (TIGR04551 family)
MRGMNRKIGRSEDWLDSHSFRSSDLPVQSLLLVAALLFSREAKATGFTDIGQDIHPRDKVEVDVDGYLRTRGTVMYDLDLDRGLTPSGTPLFPVPVSNPNSHTLESWDSRFRTDVAVYTPGAALAVKARVDWLDNIALGSAPVGIPAASTTQSPASSSLMHIKRAYGEYLTPIGLLAAGRMGNQWGLGILANGGDCADCDSGDVVDRIAFLAPILGHVVAAAYDFSASEVFAPQQTGTTFLNLVPTASVHTVTVAMLKFKSAEALERRRRAGRTTAEYGAYFSYRWQNDDVPATYLPVAAPIAITPSQVMYRGYDATAVDFWGRLTTRLLHVELEAAYLSAVVKQPSLIPGVLYDVPVTSQQFGGALESEVAEPGGPLGAGLDAGYASGDNSPGFGAFPVTGAPPAKPGDLDGPKANPPYHDTVNNFRFEPDYRIDQILFREIIGTVTGVTYVRPHARWRLTEMGSGALALQVAGVASWAVYALSAPGDKHPLGIEIDPTLAYQTREGFLAALDYGVLFPLAGLDNVNVTPTLTAHPAQLARLRLQFFF